MLIRCGGVGGPETDLGTCDKEKRERGREGEKGGVWGERERERGWGRGKEKERDWLSQFTPAASPRS